MRLSSMVAAAVLSVAGSCLAQTSPALCPRHMETPEYPIIARFAGISGKVVLRVTIGADGSVIKAAAIEAKPIQMLDDSAIANIRQWTFAKPPKAPYVETIVYDFEFDHSLPAEGGEGHYPAITKVSFDLPDRVTVRTNLEIID